jgi:lipoprotein-releasing system permease protein
MKSQSCLWLYRNLLFSRGLSKTKKHRLIGAIVLIALVMIPLVLSLVFMDGMMGGITNKYILLQDGHVQIHSPQRIFEDTAAARQVDSRILAADYVTMGYGIVYSRSATAEVRIKGVEPVYFNAERLAQFKIDGNPLEKTGSLAAVMLSSSTAIRLGLEVGDRVALMVVPDVSVAVVRPVLAQVSSIFDSGYHQLDSTLLFMSAQDALRLFPAVENARTEILLYADYAHQLDQVINTIADSIDGNFHFSTWDEFNRAVYQNFITSRQVILMVFIMIILVAGVYIAAIAGEIVQDDFQSIAVLKAMGSHTGMLLRAYFLTVFSITLVGMGAGIGLGLLLSTRLGGLLSFLSASGLAGLQYYLLDFPVVVSWRDLILVSAALLVISSLTVLFTLRRIGKISPLELLQQD